MKVTIEYVADWFSDSGDDQRGHINVTTPTGKIEATWSCSGGMGRGAAVVSNTTAEFNDDDADNLVNTTDLCQGNGVYTANVEKRTLDHNSWFTVSNVEWVELVG